MLIQTFFKSLSSTSTRRRPTRRRPPASRLWLEALEDRCLLSFNPAVSYPVGAYPDAVVTGDFNGDGRLDLAVANLSSSTVSILLGNGDGTFQAAHNYATGAGPMSLAVGDFNRDGKLDLVTSNNNRSLSVLLGNGDGTFRPAQNTPLNFLPNSTAVGDLNGDGKLDLVATWNESINGSWFGRVSVLLGHGDGTFAVPTTQSLGYSYLTSAVLHDFNADGKLDLATTDYVHGVRVLAGNGDGTFGAPADYTAGSVSVVVGDVNGDGISDLITRGNNGVSVLLGNGRAGVGDGTFQPAQNTALDFSPDSLAVGDFNADGKLDLVGTSNEYHYSYWGPGYWTSSVNVLLGHGDGTFDVPRASNFGYSPLFGPATGDFNGDGFSDVVATDHSNEVSVLLNTRDWRSFQVSGFPSAAIAGDAHTVTVTALDNGKLLSSYTGTVHFTSSDYQAVMPPDYTFVAADGGKHTFAVTLKTAGTQTIIVSDTMTAGVSGGSQSTQVSPAALSRFRVDGFVTAQTIGTLGSFSVTPTDAFGNLVSGYTGTVHFSSTDPAAALPADYTFTPADTYGHSFDATFRTPGLQTITATDTAAPNITGSQGGIEVTGASTFAVYGFPTPIVAGTAGNFYVETYDVYGQLVVGYSGTVHFTSTDAAAALPADYTFTSADQGAHTFAATLQTAGTQSITATATANAGVTGTQGGITVNAAIKALTVAGFPSPVTAGVAGNLTVIARSANGNIATWYTGTVVFSSSDTRAALPGTYTFTAADAGVHTFNATLKTAGTQSITVTDTTTASLTGTDGGITVKPGAASRFLIRAPSSVSAGVLFSLTITVQDAYGNVVTGYTGTIHFTSTDTMATLPKNYTFTAADKGVHTFTGLVLRKKGTQKITITDTLNSSLTGSVIENVL